MLGWCTLALVMSANGIVRELLLRRTLTDGQADVASAAIGLGLILLVTWYWFRELGVRQRADRLKASGALLLLTVTFELAVGRLVDDKSWAELAGNYAIWRGHLWPVLLLAVVASPWLWMRAEHIAGVRVVTREDARASSDLKPQARSR